jgi:hypothetical protein
VTRDAVLVRNEPQSVTCIPRWRARAVALGVALLLLGLAAPVRADPKTDVVVLKNGDRLTCEIQRLFRGKLRVKTDDMGTVDIEWDKIESLTGKGLFEIEDLAGHLYFGPLETIPERGLQVARATGIETVPLLSVARIMMIEASFWKRLSGSIGLGFGYTKSSDLAEFSGDVVVKFARPTFSAEFKANSFIQRQEGVDDTTRNSTSLSYTRALGSRRFALGRLSAEQNRELGFDLRAGFSGAWGRYLLRGQGNEIVAAAGLFVNREVPVEGGGTTNLEALFGFDWANFAYDFPKTDIEITSLLYVSLTDRGRYRVNLDGRLDRELFSDFHLVLKGFYNYDSRSPTTGEKTDDYQVSLTLAYKF